MQALRILSLSLALLVVGASVASAQATPAPADSGRDKVVMMLSGYEFFPTRSQLEAAAPNAPELLAALSRDETQLPSLRIRAIDALGLFDDHPVAARHFEGVLAAGGLDESCLRHSLTSSLKAFGPRALPWVQPYLSHTDSQIRLDAAYATSRFGGPDGVEMLRFRKSLESDPFVRDQLTKLVSQGVGR
jgi:hypothetical protein